MSKDDVHVSYLPLAHVFERAVQSLLWIRGAQIAFFRGNVLELPSDLQAARSVSHDTFVTLVRVSSLHPARVPASSTRPCIHVYIVARFPYTAQQFSHLSPVSSTVFMTRFEFDMLDTFVRVGLGVVGTWVPCLSR